MCSAKVGDPAGACGFAPEEYIEYKDEDGEIVMIPLYIITQHIEKKKNRWYWIEGSDFGEGEVEDDWLNALYDAGVEI